VTENSASLSAASSTISTPSSSTKRRPAIALRRYSAPRVIRQGGR
jgi:hypothetical protein